MGSDLFGLYLDGVDERIILDRHEIEFEHPVGSGLYMIEGHHRSPAGLTLQDVKIFEQRLAIAVDIENAAPLPSWPPIDDTKPPL